MKFEFLKSQKFFLCLAALSCGLSQNVSACAVCFGASDSSQTHALNWAIVSLLGIVGGVLATIFAFIVYLGRKSSAACTSADLELSSLDLSVAPYSRLHQDDPSFLLSNPGNKRSPGGRFRP